MQISALSENLVESTCDSQYDGHAMSMTSMSSCIFFRNGIKRYNEVNKDKVRVYVRKSFNSLNWHIVVVSPFRVVHL